MQEIDKAVEILQSGGLVAFPTETVYGLGADASNPLAVEKIFLAKARPADHPVIVHIYAEEQLEDLAATIPTCYTQLAKHFWPGPLTMIFKAKAHVPKIITGGQDSIGIRMPSHPIARELLKQFYKPIAAPSANRFGRISPTKASHVQEELGDKVQLILDGGDCPLGIESTIVDITQAVPTVLRAGPLDLETLQSVSQLKNIRLSSHLNKSHPRVSGNLLSHYAPATPLEILNATTQVETLKDVAVMSFQAKPSHVESIWMTMPNHPVYYAKILYAVLRDLDKKNLSAIYVEMPQDEPQWYAVRDRLQRAAAK